MAQTLLMRRCQVSIRISSKLFERRNKLGLLVDLRIASL